MASTIGQQCHARNKCVHCQIHKEHWGHKLTITKFHSQSYLRTNKILHTRLDGSAVKWTKVIVLKCQIWSWRTWDINKLQHKCERLKRITQHEAFKVGEIVLRKAGDLETPELKANTDQSSSLLSSSSSSSITFTVH